MNSSVRFVLLAFVLALLSLTLSRASTSTVGYWRFEEGSPNTTASGSGTILDSSGFMDHGTPFGSPSYKSDVPVSIIPQTGAANGLSMEFDSSDDQIFFASQFVFNQPGDATLEFWLKYPSGTTQIPSVFWGRSDCDDTDRFHIYVNPDQTIGADYREPSGTLHPIVGGGEPCCGVPILPDTWTHIALTRAGNTYSLYRDGVLMSIQNDDIPTLPISNGWSMSGRCGFEFIGSVDEVRISNRALVPAEFLNSTPPLLSVSIDIKPNSFPNSVNLGSRGTLPVAIISTGTFDARTVDPSTVTLASAPVRLRGQGTPMAAAQDINGDGRLDLVVHVSTEALQLTETDTEAVLEGRTFDGKRIRGIDTIRVVP